MLAYALPATIKQLIIYMRMYIIAIGYHMCYIHCTKSGHGPGSYVGAIRLLVVT